MTAMRTPLALLALADEVKQYKTWTKVSKEIILPATATYNQRIKVFVWRGTATR